MKTTWLMIGAMLLAYMPLFFWMAGEAREEWQEHKERKRKRKNRVAP